MLGFVLGGILCLVLFNFQEEPPLFHVQDRANNTGGAYYLCYTRPRPWWYIERALEYLDEWEKRNS